MKSLREFTTARVDLPVAGESLATQPLLELRLAHARARDAVHLALDPHLLAQEFDRRKWAFLNLHTAARNRQEYLLRPDLGRKLDDTAVAALRLLSTPLKYAFVVADGLSALAVHRHAVSLLDAVLSQLAWTPTRDQPIFVVQQGRVAIGDDIGDVIQAELSIVLIGERPGLSSPDSLGVYITWSPRHGRTEAERNCISNIHANGLSYEAAARKLLFLIREAQHRKLTGFTLKETADGLRSIPE